MGLIARVLSFVRTTANGAKASDVKVDAGGGDNMTAQHAQAAGEDSHPLPEDFAVLVHVRATGRTVAVGYVDPANSQKAEAGEVRRYARDANGEEVVEFWLKADGSAVVSNGNGTIELRADGVIDLNGATVLTDGTIISPTAVQSPSIEANGRELAGHTHVGSPTAPTGPISNTGANI